MNEQRADRIAKLAMPLSGTCFVVALILSWELGHGWPWVLLAPAGIALVARALLMLTDYHGIPERLAEREAHGLPGRLGFARETRYGGAVLLLIGLGWLAAAVLSA